MRIFFLTKKILGQWFAGMFVRWFLMIADAWYNHHHHHPHHWLWSHLSAEGNFSIPTVIITCGWHHKHHQSILSLKLQNFHEAAMKLKISSRKTIKYLILNSTLWLNHNGWIIIIILVIFSVTCPSDLCFVRHNEQLFQIVLTCGGTLGVSRKQECYFVRFFDLRYFDSNKIFRPASWV